MSFSDGRQRQTRKKNWYDNEENLSDAVLHKIIENKFQLHANENRIISYGVEPSEIQKLYKWPLFTKNTKLIMFQVIYQTRETVFHLDIQTLRRELKIRRAAEYF